MDPKDKKQESTQQTQSVAETTEPKRSSIERQADLFVQTLQTAKDNGGVWLNNTCKPMPHVYERNVSMSPFNALILAMHSDLNNHDTNEYTFFSDAKQRNESVKSKQSGVPFNWYAWNEFANRQNPEQKISRSDYQALSPEEQQDYRPLRNKEVRILFNLGQTTMPLVNKEIYQSVVEKSGRAEDRPVSEKDDMKLRVAVNQLILNVRDNLVKVTKDGSGEAVYDKEKDVVHIPPQNAYVSYPEYVQDMTRQVIAATGTNERLARHGSKNHELLVTELASAVKQLQFALPAKLSPKAMEQLDFLTERISKNPQLLNDLERDINAALGMVVRAENGEKIQRRPTEKEITQWRDNLPRESVVPDKFDAVLMVKDDAGKWALYVKPENDKAFSVHPDAKDVTMFFNLVKHHPTEKTETFRMEMAQKYYAEVAAHPDKKIDLFKSNASQEDLAKLERVNIFKTKPKEGEESRILCVPTVNGERLKAKELTNDQWQKMWLAPDMQDYKKHLAATLYAEELKTITKVEQSASLPKEQTPEVKKTEVEAAFEDEEEEVEDKECAKLLKEIAKLEKQTRTEKMPNRQRELFLQKQQLEKKLEDRVKMLREQAGGNQKTESSDQKSEQKGEQKSEKKIELSPMLKQFVDLKKKHPEALLLFRCGDFYETYMEDAEKASKILGITLTKSSKTKDTTGKPLAMAGFPYHALDTYLPKLIRAGQRVAICDQIEAPKQTAQRGVVNAVAGKEAPKQEQKQEEKNDERQHRGFHR